MFVPEPLPAGAIGRAAEHVDGDGAGLRFTVMAETVDEGARRVVRSCRYEAFDPDGTTESTDRDWILHWYTQDGFRALVDAAGLEVSAALREDATPAGGDDAVFVFWLTRPS